MRTAIVLAALLHQALSFLAPPVRVVPSLRVKSATRATPDDDAAATAAEDAVAAVEDDTTPKRRPLRGLWRRLRRRKAEEAAEPEPEQPPLKVGESVVVEATGRSGKVSLVAANGWCQVTYDDEECEGQTETLQCPDLVREEAALAETIDAEVSDFDEVLIKWGFKEDPRIPEECRVDQMTRIKDSGQAGVIAYAITEAGFWVGSIPFALGAAYVATGEIPDWTTEEGKTALGGYAFVLINFARLIVPARIALALAFAPWVDENIVKRFNPPDPSDLPEDCVIEESEEE
jgi:hypothetical protein